MVMNKKLIPIIVAQLVIALLGDSNVDAKEVKTCKRITLESYKSAIVNQKYSHIVFFASWCSACKDDLLGKYENPMFIAAFDNIDAASRAFYSIAHVNSVDCFFDIDNTIAHYLNVSGLPFIKKI
jgi:hypothetical protein